MRKAFSDEASVALLRNAENDLHGWRLRDKGGKTKTNYSLHSAIRSPKFFSLLRARYEEITAAVSDQLARGIALEDLMGSRIDALKLVSSLTLFRAAAQRLQRDDAMFDSLDQLCRSMLACTSASCYLPCVQTARQLAPTAHASSAPP